MRMPTLQNEILTSIQNVWFVALLFLMTVIEIVPLRINPWTSIFKLIGRVMNGEIMKIQNQIDKEWGNNERSQGIKR